MTFLWIHLLWLLLFVPALVALYIVLLRRKKKAALRYASLAMVRDAMGARQTDPSAYIPLFAALGCCMIWAMLSIPLIKRLGPTPTPSPQAVESPEATFTAAA